MMNASGEQPEHIESYLLDEARCQACGERMPKFDGVRVALTATVACSQACWEQLTGILWRGQWDEWSEEPTRA